jgi:hypothetical protein
MNPNIFSTGTGINPNGGNSGSTWSFYPAQTDVFLENREIQQVGNIYFTDGTNYSDATTTQNASIAGISNDINILFNPPMATYYKDTSQNFPSGDTSITFELLKSWSDTTLITQTSPTDFTVNQSGIYQLELNVTISNLSGSTWTNFSKYIQITLNRNGTDRTIGAQFGYANSGSNFILSLSLTYELLENDIINLKVISFHTSNLSISSPNPFDTFDLNTYFTWRAISKTYSS